MEILQENVEFEVTNVRFDSLTERLTIKMRPLNNSRYLEEMHIAFHYKHDYSDYKFYRRFMNQNNFTPTDINNLIGKRFRGSVARFTRSDGTEFEGPYSSSLQLITDISPAGKVKSVIKTTELIANKGTSTMSNKNPKSLKKMAALVLNEKGPLHTKLIWEEIARRGYVSNGKSPDATVGAHIYMDIKKNGDKSIFVKTGPNTFDLRNKTTVPAQTSLIEEAPVFVQENMSISVVEEVASSLTSMFLTGIKKALERLRNHV
jgi:hypothetical protein